MGVELVLSLLGGLALFMYGMQMMRIWKLWLETV